MDINQNKEKETLKKTFKDAMKSIKIIKKSDGTVELAFDTGFKFFIYFIILFSIIIISIMIYYKSMGTISENPYPYGIFALSILLLIIIQANFKSVLVLNTVRSVFFRKRKFFSMENISREKPFSDIRFVTIRTKPAYASRGAFSEHYIVLILRDGSIVKSSDSINEWNVDEHIPETKEISEIVKAQYLEPEREKCLKIQATPVNDISALKYISLKDMNRKFIWLIITVISLSIIAALITALLM